MTIPPPKLVSAWEEEEFERIAGEQAAPFSARILAAVERVLGRGMLLSLRFCGDEEMADLHRRFFGDARPTDVLAFPFREEGEASGEGERDPFPERSEGEGTGNPERVPLGEIIVCVPEAERRAKEHGNTTAAELALYVVHGALHLAGFDDHDPASLERMKTVEAQCLELLDLEVRGRFGD